MASDALHSLLQLFLDILKMPFLLLARYMKDEFVTAVKQDTKRLALMTGLAGFLFVLLSVLWFSVSVLVAVWFYDHGNNLLLSVLYSALFQLAVMVVVGLIIVFSLRNMQTRKMIRKIKKYGKERS